MWVPEAWMTKYLQGKGKIYKYLYYDASQVLVASTEVNEVLSCPLCIVLTLSPGCILVSGDPRASGSLDLET